MIYTVTLNPTIDRSLVVESFAVGGTFKAADSQALPAGKGINVARVVAVLGEPVVALGLVGASDAIWFDETLAEAGIENRLLPVPGPTRSSVTILDPANGAQTHLREPGSAPPAAALEQVADALQHVQPGDWVVFSGSLPPGVPVQIYQDWIRRCTERGAHTLLDANGPSLLAGADAPPTLLKPNLFELEQLVAGQAESRAEAERLNMAAADILAAARSLQTRGTALVVVSMGERGLLALDRDGRGWHAETRLDGPAIDTVGCGDALAAGLVVALARGTPWPGALQLGVACGAANALVPGAGCCRIEDIERLATAARVDELDR